MRKLGTSRQKVAGVLAWAWLGFSASALAQAVQVKPGAGAPAPEAVPAPAVQNAGASGPAQGSFTNRPDDEKAIKAAAEVFTRAYDSGDSAAVAALFTDDAEMIDEFGDVLEGRAAIQDFYARMFRERPGTRITVSMAALRFLGPDVAREVGHTRVTPAGGEPATLRRYTVLFVKQAGKWLYSSVREEHASGIVHHERLKALEWMVGDWLDQSSDSTVHVTCQWSPDKNFLLRDFTIHVQGQPVMTVNQRIGWDPLHNQIRSWVFDSEGGFGEGIWTRKGNIWVIKSTGVLTDGRIATATNTLTPVGPNSVKWSSTERTLGDQFIGEPAEYVMVRRPPPPK
jgi:uncharacterized protein (TIGR02246 family)